MNKENQVDIQPDRRIPLFGDLQDFVIMVRESRSRADQERRNSERAVRIMLKEPPFETDMFPARAGVGEEQ